jgi:rusticyanin
MGRRRTVLVIATAALALGGLGAGLAVAFAGSSRTSPSPGTPSYSWYRSMMGGLGYSSMMGNSNYSSMMGQSGYGWMMGGSGAPGWMYGGTLPSYMMGESTDPGKVMGQLFENEPGTRVSSSSAARLGAASPAGAKVDRATKNLTFTSKSISLVVLASPSGDPDETFRIAGMVNPTIVVPTGSHISLEVVNADSDTAHGLVITANASASSSRMPMMTATPAFSGSALWFLGDPTSAGMHTATISFTAGTPGTYKYLCAVPGHAEKGMVGTFIVEQS